MTDLRVPGSASRPAIETASHADLMAHMGNQLPPNADTGDVAARLTAIRTSQEHERLIKAEKTPTAGPIAGSMASDVEYQAADDATGHTHTPAQADDLPDTSTRESVTRVRLAAHFRRFLAATAAAKSRMDESDEVRRVHAPAQVAKLTAEGGDVPGALEVARSIDTATGRAAALAWVAHAMSDGHDVLAESLQVARAIERASERMVALAAVAGAMSEGDDVLAEALDVAQSIDKPSERLKALTQVGEVMAAGRGVAMAEVDPK